MGSGRVDMADDNRRANVDKIAAALLLSGVLVASGCTPSSNQDPQVQQCIDNIYDTARETGVRAGDARAVCEQMLSMPK